MRIRSDKMREKRRLAKEKMAKIREEKKRNREIREEKWTNKNENILISEHRKAQRSSHLENIRKECLEMLEVVEIDQAEKKNRIELLKSEIDLEVKDISNFIDETCQYYDEIHQQISPPEEKNVEQIVKDIEIELQKMFDIFSSCFEFVPKMPENSDFQTISAEKDKTFQKDKLKLEEEIEKAKVKSEELVKEISKQKNEIEMENVRFAAIKKDKQTDNMLKSKKILKLQETLKNVTEDPVERGEIIQIENQIAKLQKEKNMMDEMLEELSKIMKRVL